MKNQVKPVKPQYKHVVAVLPNIDPPRGSVGSVAWYGELPPVPVTELVFFSDMLQLCMVEPRFGIPVLVTRNIVSQVPYIRALTST